MYFNQKLIDLLHYLHNNRVSYARALRIIQAYINHAAPELGIILADHGFNIMFLDYEQAAIVTGHSAFYFEY